MEKVFKYQKLMNEKGVITPCPFLNCKENNLTAFHFGFSEIENKNNFKPGHKKRNIKINDKSDIKNCAYCGLSMYKTKEAAIDKWNIELLERVRKLLGFTHLLEGTIEKDMGVMSIEKGAHFTFFEYEEVELKNSFKVLEKL